MFNYFRSPVKQLKMIFSTLGFLYLASYLAYATHMRMVLNLLSNSWKESKYVYISIPLHSLNNVPLC